MRKWKNSFFKNSFARKLVSICLALAMLLTMLPSNMFSIEANAATGKTITIHFNNSDSNWSKVYGYTWNTSGNTQYSGTWPGTQISKNSYNSGWYDLVVNVGTAAKVGVIFNDGSGTQTADIIISGVTDGGEYWCWPDSVDGPSYDAPGGWNTNSTARDVTIHYQNTSNWSSVYGYAWHNGSSTTKYLNGTWPGNQVTENSDHSGWYTMTLTDVTSENIGVIFNNKSDQTSDIYISDIPAENAEYWYNGNLSSTAPLGWSDDDDAEGKECTVKLHFLNTLGWNAVCAYAWRANSSGTVPALGDWPGTILSRDEDGYYTLKYSYTVTSGESLGYIFTNNLGSQTVDLSIDYSTLSKGSVELWIQPGALDESGKYTCTVSTSESGLCISPEVDGTSVTFRYSGSVSSSIYVCGNMNDWSTNSTYKMSKGSDGVWYVTVTLPAGTYQYKYVVDGEWINDPLNPVVVGNSGNNVLIVPEDTSKKESITVKLHFLCGNNADYINTWDAWMWYDSVSGGYKFTETNGELVATISDIPSDTISVGYIIRKSDWSDQEFNYDRYIDLSQIYSGTVHYYVTSGEANGVMVCEPDVVTGGKVTSAEYDYENEILKVYASLPITDYDGISIYDSTYTDSVSITNISASGSTYTVTLNREMEIQDVFDYRIEYNKHTFSIDLNVTYDTEKFIKELTYDGDDLGSTWSEDSTTFKVWAPTAEYVKVQLYSIYSTGNSTYGYAWYKTVDMTREDYGVWSVTIEGDLNGTYYDYLVKVNGNQTSAIDPYAKAGNIYGNLAMVINLDATDPVGWDQDVSPNQGMVYNDAIIYEMSIRDFSIDDSSGVSDEYQGKFLALTETGTTTNGDGGHCTGLDYLIDLGITHVQLMPITDFNTEGYYSWGYDVKNHNFPEDSYSTDPYHGEVRVEEVKEMVQTLHDNGISVVMDVVYNHVYDGGSFCFNKLVPGYFSRMQPDGSYYSCSGCGNDTATENEMVRKYIVESVLYWVEEYHIDGFRFDMAGNIDTDTINAIKAAVHAKYPSVLLYGEGWTTGADDIAGTSMATQGNSWITGYFGYFNDVIRDKTFSYATGSTGDRSLEDCFKSTLWYTSDPTRVINYLACHDGYTLTDKLLVYKDGTEWNTLVKMGSLAASVVLLSEGVPFIQGGDEFLREKVDENGYRYDNSYDKPDSINSFKWTLLDNTQKSDVSDYYKGLIAFRKNHAALRLTSSEEVADHVHPYWYGDNVLAIYIDGVDSLKDEVSRGIIIIFNNSYDSQTIDIKSLTAVANVYYGTWDICVDSDYAGKPLAGTDSLYQFVIGDGEANFTVDPYSTTVMVLGDRVDTDSVYTKNAPVKDKFDISFSNMTLGNSLAMNFAFEADSVTDWEGHYVTVTKTYADGSANVVETYEYDDGDWTATTINDSAYYYVSFDGIAAKEMADNVYVTVYNEDGKEVSNTYEDSVRAYAMRALDNSANSDECKTMIVDMLNYGAAAQSYFTYNEDDLANNELSDEQKAYATASVECENTREKDSDTYYCGTSLILESNIRMQMAFKNLTTDMYAVVTYTDHYGNTKEISVSGSEFIVDSGYYIVDLNTIVVADGRKPVTFTIYDSDDKAVTTVTDSIESYLARTSENYEDELFILLMKFSDSAYAYFH